ncbi:MAG: pyridoxal phosphate-dependent aminotransferase [Bacteroidales bacterium]|nr:pyridoxal phosphate-dependent aminotransferase [Bacteroidales bacterium]
MKYVLPEGSLISFFSNKVKQFGGINLAQGIPGFAPPQQLMESLSNVALNPKIHQYAPGVGNFQLLDKLCEHYQSYAVQREHLLIVQGATEAITLIYLYLKQKIGTLNVLGFDPVYESYNNLPRYFNDHFFPYNLHDNKIDFKQFEQDIVQHRIHLVFVNTPGNPYGKIFSKSDIETIIALSQKYQFYIIIDAVYRELYFNEPPYIPIDTNNPWIFYVNSFSKLFSITGWRVGYFICNAKHMKHIRSLHDYTGLCVANPMQTALIEYILKAGIVNNYVVELREKLKTSFDKLHQALKELGFEIPPIDGGYFIWAKLPSPYDDGFRFAIDLYEQQKVAIIPGIHFSPNGKNFVRFNAARELNEIEAGIDGLKKFIQN